MKNNFILATCLSLFAFFPKVDAATEARANQLEIGPDVSDQVSINSTYSGAIGQNNVLNYADSTLLVGYNNNSSGGAGASLSVGYYNQSRSAGTATIGSNNYNYGISNMLMVGSYNSDTALYGDEDAWVSSNSIIGGSYNQSTAINSSLIAGQNNSAWNAESSGIIGHGLINNWNHCTVVGQYNLSQGGTSLLFVVGNGADASNRKNAVEVYNDGVVIIPKRQGDIVMGSFGNGNGD